MGLFLDIRGMEVIYGTALWMLELAVEIDWVDTATVEIVIRFLNWRVQHAV